MNTFDALYSEVVDAFIAENRSHVRQIYYDHNLWNVYRNWNISFCMNKAEYYKIPNHIIKLLDRFHDHPIVSVGSQGIRIGLNVNARWHEKIIADINGNAWFPTACEECGGMVRHVYHRNVVNICDDCYRRVGGEVITIHISRFNVLDWVQFACVRGGRGFYTNCNTGSPDYGKIIRVDDYGDNLSIVFVDTSVFMTKLHSWFMQSNCIEESTAVAESFLNNKSYGHLLQYCMPHITNRYVLEHCNDTWSDYGVNVYIRLIREHRGYDPIKECDVVRVGNRSFSTKYIAKYAHANMHSISKIKVFPEKFIEKVKKRLIREQCMYPDIFNYFLED